MYTPQWHYDNLSIIRDFCLKNNIIVSADGIYRRTDGGPQKILVPGTIIPEEYAILSARIFQGEVFASMLRHVDDVPNVYFTHISPEGELISKTGVPWLNYAGEMFIYEKDGELYAAYGIFDHDENAFIIQYIAINTGELGDFSFSIDHLKPDDCQGVRSPKRISNIAAIDNRVMVFGVIGGAQCFVYYPDSEKLTFIEFEDVFEQFRTAFLDEYSQLYVLTVNSSTGINNLYLYDMQKNSLVKIWESPAWWHSSIYRDVFIRDGIAYLVEFVGRPESVRIHAVNLTTGESSSTKTYNIHVTQLYGTVFDLYDDALYAFMIPSDERFPDFFYILYRFSLP
jgi:hypothetical protein